MRDKSPVMHSTVYVVLRGFDSYKRIHGILARSKLSGMISDCIEVEGSYVQVEVGDGGEHL